MKLENDLGKDNIRSLVVKLALPTMLSQLVNVLYSIIDRMFIGNIPVIGDMALAGVGISSPIVSLISSFGTLIGIGGSILMAMRMGAKDYKSAEEILGNSFKLLVGISLSLTVIFLVIKNPLIYLFGASETTFVHANTYLTIYTLGSFFAIMALGLTYFITCQGFARISMITVCIGAITNIILDAVFIFTFNMGVAGAAWATVIAQMCSCLFAIHFLRSNKCPITIKNIKLRKKVVSGILKIGLSPFIILAMDSILLIAMNTSLQSNGGPGQGDTLISTVTIMQSYLFLITGPLIGLSGGTQSILSFNYGARNSQRIKQAEKDIVIFGLLLTTVMFIVTKFAAPAFVHLFTSSPELADMACRGIPIYTMAIIPLSLQYVFVDGLTALGMVKTALGLSMFRKSIYLGSAFLLPMFFPVETAFYAEPLSDALSALVTTIVFGLTFKKHIDFTKESSHE